MFYNSVLRDCIEREIAGSDYTYDDEDKAMLLNMMNDINTKMHTNIQYLAELDTFHVFGAGEIIVKYIHRFSSESVKAFLLPQLVLDKVNNCDKLILQLYLHFRESKEYISEPGKPSPAHITVRYDNAFRTLKSKGIANELIHLISSPRDAFYLPLTVKMLASWRISGLDKLLLTYSKPDSVTMMDVGLKEDGQIYYPSFSFIRKELRFIAINGLRYFPTPETMSELQLCAADPEEDIRSAAIKIIKKLSS